MNAPTDWLAEDTLAIFLLHGVTDARGYEVRNYRRKHLPVEEFRGHMQRLGEVGQPLSMDDVVEIFTRGLALPARSFAVTFDDGFENNATVAAPILRELDIPATIYVSTDFIENATMSWIDRIELCIEICPEGELKLPWRPDPVRWNSVPGRIELLEAIRDHVKHDAGVDPDALAGEIFEQLGRPPVNSSDDPLDRKLSWDQLAELNADPLFIIGGHSHHHHILSFLDPHTLREEIDTSLSLLRERIGLEAEHYSYPEGKSDCFSPEVIELLRSRGVICCPTAMPGVNAPESDLFHLRRIKIN